MSETSITLTVNGRVHHLRVQESDRLLDILRNTLGLAGVKEGCGSGECGTCNVILNGELVNACIIFAVQANGGEVLTIEGLGKQNNLHPIQEAFLEAGAVQCGFCTPGMILASKWLLDHHAHPSEDEIKEALSGNLCRCTGYQKIFQAVQLAVTRLTGTSNKGSDDPHRW